MIGIVAGAVGLLAVVVGFVIWQASKLESAHTRALKTAAEKTELEVDKTKLEHAVEERDRGLTIVHAEVRRLRNAIETAEDALQEPIPQNKQDMASAVARALSLLRPEKVPKNPPT